MGWRNASFRGFADYMQTPDFDAGLRRLVKLAKQKKIALMCAEVVPWRCHRSLIADALVLRGIRVKDIISGKVPRFIYSLHLHVSKENALLIPCDSKPLENEHSGPCDGKDFRFGRRESPRPLLRDPCERRENE
jgi:hypothetical protein